MKKYSQDEANKLFTDLFVLELANNHWGSVERGKEIIRQHGKVVQEMGVKAAIKFQFRDVDTFVHSAFKPAEKVAKEGEVVQAPGSSSRYIKKTIATKLTPEEFAELLSEVKEQGMLTMATPFDEKSVKWCGDLDVDIVKIASQDAKSWVLIERIVELGKPAIISNGGTDIEDLDRVVHLFEEKKVPLAINHCVSLYPSEDEELELNQVDYLKKRYPGHVIGYSTHEYHDWSSSVQITYAKGARTWERHIDIEDAEGTPVSKYCSLPHQVREWFQAFLKAKEMTGGISEQYRFITEKEKDYVQSVSRGAYALRDLPAGTKISKAKVGTDFEFVIPLQGTQLSSRDLDSDIVLQNPVKKGNPIFLSEASLVSNESSFKLSVGAIKWVTSDSFVRITWALSLYALVISTGFFIGVTFAILSTASLLLVAGVVMTSYHRYELYPGLAKSFGGAVNGILLGGTLTALMLMANFLAPISLLFMFLGVGMVTTALFGRFSVFNSLRTTSSMILGLTMLGVFIALFLKQFQLSLIWPYFALGIIVLSLTEQLIIRTFKTNVLLPWVHIFWNAIGLLFFAGALLAWSKYPLFMLVNVMLSSPLYVGVLALASAGLLVSSVFTRLKMRKTKGGSWRTKRLVGLSGILLVALVLTPNQLLLFTILAGLLLLTAVYFGDK